MRFLDPDPSAFAMSLHAPQFVDKTGLIKVINPWVNTDQCFFCVSRPRRFGKTIALQMLSAYYGVGGKEQSPALFQNLEIAASPDYTKHINQYHVLRLDILELSNNLEARRINQKSDSEEDYKSMSLVRYINEVVMPELKETFPGCSDWKGGLSETLADIYENCSEHPKVVILIDEFDYLFRKKDPMTSQESYMNFLCGLFKGAGNLSHIALAYMTGIYPIKKYGTQSSLNNFRELTMIHPGVSAPCFGFTDSEVKSLCDRCSADFKQIRDWYKGYRLRGIPIYNPMSVVAAIEQRQIRNYWSQSETYSVLRSYINLDLKGLRQLVALLMNGFSIYADTTAFSSDFGTPETRDEALTCLVHLGYLSCESRPGRLSMLRIPNKEILEEFKNSTRTPEYTAVFDELVQSEFTLRATWGEKEEEVASYVNEMHQKLASSFDFNDEYSLSCVLQLSYYTAKAHYDITKEENTGRGRADLFFRPMRGSAAVPMIVELKWDAITESAIDQVKQKKYWAKLSKYPEILLVGISYSTRTGEHHCKIERWKNP